jgi:hypothetical protein
LVQDLAVLLKGGSAAKLRRESTVSFRMVKGRVYHQGMELEFPDLTIRTYGSVGLVDQSLSLMAEMPVPPKWLGNNPVGDALKNQTVQLPIGGTLSRPQLDRVAMEQANRKLLGSAAQNVLQGEVNKGLNRLFGPTR